MSGAALVVAVVVGRKGRTAFDAARAAQNMMLAASNEGIGSCPNGIADAARLTAALGHGEDESVAMVLTFGYPAKPRRDPESLPAVEWVARADRLAFEEIVREAVLGRRWRVAVAVAARVCEEAHAVV